MCINHRPCRGQLRGCRRVAAFWILCGACAGPQSLKPNKLASPSKLALPTRVDESNYSAHRELYEALPPDLPDRTQYRRILLAYLRKAAERDLADKQATAAAKRFDEATTLYAPSEVYRGVVPDPQLVALARSIQKQFAPAGDAERVLPALCVQISAGDPSGAIQREAKTILAWLDETARLTVGAQISHIRGVRVLESAVRRWSSPFVVEALREAYIAQAAALSRLAPPRRGRLSRRRFGSMLDTGYKIARLYLRVGMPERALEQLAQLSQGHPADRRLRRLLERTVGPSSDAGDHVRLAEMIEDRDADIALATCRESVRRFPNDSRGYACTGRIAGLHKKLHLSVFHYQAAVRLSPKNQGYAEALAKQYQRRLFRSIERERLSQAQAQLKQIEKFYAEAKRRYGRALQPTLGVVYYAIGHGLYNAGQVAKAKLLFSKAMRVRKWPKPMMLMASIHLKTGRNDDALAQLRRAEQLPMKSAEERIYWQARLDGLKAEALAQAGDQEGSQRLHRSSVEAWKLWLRLGLRPAARAEAHYHQARSLYALGETAEALDGFDAAIDAKPDRKETYADVVAYLSTRGHLPEAVDAYHRALGRSEVTEYLKTYCSFWILGLYQRIAKPADVLATNYLSRLKGAAWYVRLAEAVLGKRSFESLSGLAKTRAQQAELHFYWANRLLAQGRKERARALWKKVVASEMMAFFEYDMALYNLRHGPAKIKQEPIDRRTPPKAPKRDLAHQARGAGPAAGLERD